LVWSPEEYLRRQVPALFATERALNGDGLKREFLDARWNIASASLACDDEALPISGHLEHVSMIGDKHDRRMNDESLVSTNTLPFRA
jgi:hypothetical protein